MNERKAAWTIAGLAPILFVVGVILFILSMETGKTSLDPDGAELEGFLILLAMTALSLLCGLISLTLLIHSRRESTLTSLELRNSAEDHGSRYRES